MACGIRGDRLAVDKLHDQKRPAIGGRTAINQARNIRMVERGEYLPLRLEALDQARLIPTAAHQLDRHILVEFGIVAASFKHQPHAAARDLGHDFVGADSLTDPVLCAVDHSIGSAISSAGHDLRELSQA